MFVRQESIKQRLHAERYMLVMPELAAKRRRRKVAVVHQPKRAITRLVTAETLVAQGVSRSLV